MMNKSGQGGIADTLTRPITARIYIQDRSSEEKDRTCVHPFYGTASSCSASKQRLRYRLHTDNVRTVIDK